MEEKPKDAKDPAGPGKDFAAFCEKHGILKAAVVLQLQGPGDRPALGMLDYKVEGPLESLGLMSYHALAVKRRVTQAMDLFEFGDALGLGGPPPPAPGDVH